MSELMPGTLGTLVSHARDGRSVILDCGGPKVAVTVLSPGIVRVRLAPEGVFPPPRSWDVPRPADDFPQTPFDLIEQDDSLLLDTGAFSIRIDRDPCRIAFQDGEDRTFAADAAAMTWSAGGVACAKRIDPDEHFFGFGERTGPLDKLGRELVNWTTDPGHFHGPGTDPMYIAIPVFLSVRPGLAYGVFFNNTWRSRFDMGRNATGTWRFEAEGGAIDYHVLFGPSPAEVTEGIGQLLGTMPLPPRWALGYHQSRWSYMTDPILRALAAEFRQRRIPCDVIHLDIDYMDGYRVFTWHPERMPDPAGLLSDLAREHFHVVTIIDPGVKIDPDYPVYREGVTQDFFIRREDGERYHAFVWPDDSVFGDFTRPEVRRWWGDWQKVLIDSGVTGVWNDMNEPTTFEKPFSEGGGDVGTIDLDAPQGPEGERTVHAEIHNLYGSGMARASYEGLRRHLGGERPFVLTRSAFAGIQRWSACWMGDNNSWWEHLEMAMPQLMNMGLSGVPFVGTDIGGFHGNASGELFARWMQMGALSPFSRGHSCAGTEQHEPWVFGPRVEAICRDYLRLRYRLLPYLYSLFWEASLRGTPVMRPLLYLFPDDPATYPLHDEFMLGPFLLAAPVYHPGREHRHVYLPAGGWYDFWTGEQFEGPTHLLAPAPLETMPIYARAGSILPTGPDLDFTDQHPLDPLTLNLYPGHGAFTLYEDDGHTFAHEQGGFCTTAYRLRLEGDELTLTVGAREGRFAPPKRRLIINLHAAGLTAAAGHAGATYDASGRTLTLDLPDDGRPHAFTFQLA